MSILGTCLGGSVLYEPRYREDGVDFSELINRLESTLGEAQGSVYFSNARFKMLCCGRRFGKTYLSILRLVTWALSMSGGREFWYVTKTQDSAKRIAWKMLQAIAPKESIAKIMLGEVSITFTNGSTICLMGADNPDSLRGTSLSGCVIDEAAYCKPKLWPEVVRPSLADTGGQCWHITTPAGLNHFHDLWEAHEDDSTWRRFSYTTLDGGRVPASEIEVAKREMDARTFRQEFLASFETLMGRVYPDFNDDNISEDVKDTGGPILWGTDFNVSVLAGVLGSRVGDTLHIWDEVSVMQTNTDEVCAMLKERFEDRKVIAYPDPTGSARKTSSAGRTDHEIIRQHGFSCMSPRTPWAVKDKINATNIMIRNANDQIRLFVHPRCKNTIKALRNVTYKEGSDDYIIDKSAGIEHWTDGLGYLILSDFNPLYERAGKGTGIRIY